MKKLLRRLVVMGAAALGLATFVNSASANSITVDFASPTVTAVGSEFRWDYAISVAANAEVQSGDGFTIYDFAGYTGTFAIPAGWSLDSSNTNAPDYLFETRASTDSPVVTDLILTYSGPDIGAALTPTSLGTFSFNSIYGLKANGFLEGLDHSIAPNLAQSNNFNTEVPLGVPVPAALWGGLGLMGALFTAKVTRRR
jgi:hypothetical protein